MGLRIKEVIKEKGMTVQTLADKMGINRVGLSNHINGNPLSQFSKKLQQPQKYQFKNFLEKEQKENINGYIEIGNEIFKITSFQDIRNIINRFDSDNS